jgi:hypothetical protein
MALVDCVGLNFAGDRIGFDVAKRLDEPGIGCVGEVSADLLPLKGAEFARRLKLKATIGVVQFTGTFSNGVCRAKPRDASISSGKSRPRVQTSVSRSA